MERRYITSSSVIRSFKRKEWAGHQMRFHTFWVASVKHQSHNIISALGLLSLTSWIQTCTLFISIGCLKNDIFSQCINKLPLATYNRKLNCFRRLVSRLQANCQPNIIKRHFNQLDSIMAPYPNKVKEFSKTIFSAPSNTIPFNGLQVPQANMILGFNCSAWTGRRDQWRHDYQGAPNRRAPSRDTLNWAPPRQALASHL